MKSQKRSAYESGKAIKKKKYLITIFQNKIKFLNSPTSIPQADSRTNLKDEEEKKKGKKDLMKTFLQEKQQHTS